MLFKNQELYLIEYLLLIIVPLISVYIEFSRITHQLSYLAIIQTSKLGKKIYHHHNERLFICICLIDIVIMIVGQYFKIKKYYSIDFSVTLKDLLIVNSNISLMMVLVLVAVSVIILIMILSKLITKLIIGR